ncbi:ovoinhibitor-like [Gopherus evgoodei]|uniref:ovoinhibitor-like n=1 Tax=Gopherus evgoodei TaxID=1825980 RepID=UPI0011CFCD30|nr:ovoinhibitor-like [Gopherus evgoodei]
MMGVFVILTLATWCCSAVALGSEADCSKYPRGTAEDGKVLTACPLILAEVCGTDGITYPSECGLCAHNFEHGTNVSKKHDGKCQQKIVPLDCSLYPSIETEDGQVLTGCPRILAEVCGTDGVTYPNDCMLCAHNDGKVLVVCHRILHTACGTDGVTYASECEMCAHSLEHGTNVSKKHDGRCKREVLLVDCSKYRRIMTEDGKVLTACPLLLKEVCGTDGITYPNECGLCAHNFKHGTNVTKKHNGKCKQETEALDCIQYNQEPFVYDGELLCPEVVIFVCDTDGVTYWHECEICVATEAGQFLVPGCGSDGVTYSNECLFCREIFRGNNIVKKHDGRCVQVDCTGYVKTPTGQEAACTLEYSPICGTNGVTYGNKCAFCSAVANGADIDQNNDEECPQVDCKEFMDDSVYCTRESNPHCGTDGMTYGNKCSFCKAVKKSLGSIRLERLGKC